MQSVLAKWYCGCLAIFMEMEMRNVGRRDKVWENLDIFGDFKPDFNNMEISIAFSFRQSQYNLGMMYQSGHGVGEDANEANRWFERYNQNK